MPRGWSLNLNVPKADRETWLSTFAQGNDPELSEIDGQLYLFTKEITDAADKEEAYRVGQLVLARVNGLMLLYFGFDPAIGSGVVCFGEDGKRHIFVDPGALLVVLPVLEPEAAAEAVRRGYAVAASSEWISRALSDFRPPVDWYGLYKVFECLEEQAGNAGTRLSQIEGISKNAISAFEHTANTLHRHPPGARGDPPKAPMNAADAFGLIRVMLAATIESVDPPPTDPN